MKWLSNSFLNMVLLHNFLLNNLRTTQHRIRHHRCYLGDFLSLTVIQEVGPILFKDQILPF